MIRRFLWPLLFAGVIGLVSACGVSRQVTTSHWVNPDLLMVGYVAVQDGELQGRVKVCERQTDNRLNCRDHAELNRHLREGPVKAPQGH